MAYTISVQHGSRVVREHNIRDEKYMANHDVTHIDAKGTHEIWRDETHREAYDRLFGEFQLAYNAKVGVHHPERMIKDYYKQICDKPPFGKDKTHKMHPVYELIVQVGDKDNHPEVDTSKEILKKFVDKMHERFPHLEMIGVYFHADEATPHLHIDYVPWSDGYKKGMTRQTGLTKALEADGLKNQKGRLAETQMHDIARKLMHGICHDMRIETIETKEATREHLETEVFKRQAQLESERAALETEIERNQADIDELGRTRDEAITQKELAEQEATQAIEKREQEEQALEQAQQEHERQQRILQTHYEAQKAQLEADYRQKKADIIKKEEELRQKEEGISGKELNIREVEALQRKLVWSSEDKQNIIKTAMQSAENAERVQNALKENEELSNDNERLEKEIEDMKPDYEDYDRVASRANYISEKNRQLEEQNKALKEDIKVRDDFIRGRGIMPEFIEYIKSMKIKLTEKVEEMRQKRSHSFDISL